MNGTELKALRIQLGYTQARLAEALDVSPTTIARWEMQSNQGRYPVPTWASIILTLWQSQKQEQP